MTDPAMTSLAEAQAWLRDRIDDGETCPCCDQFAKVYRRRLNASMARGLILFYRAHGVFWGHAPSTPGIAELGGEFARLRWWCLIQEHDGGRDDGNPHAGQWRITPTGQPRRHHHNHHRAGPRTTLQLRRTHGRHLMSAQIREHGVVFGDDRPFKWSALATELPAIVLWSPTKAQP